MLGGAAKQVNAKKQKRMAGWREEQRQSVVVRAWRLRKVNSEQKKTEAKSTSFDQEKGCVCPFREAGRRR
jgi:hypothetical protein